jgi:Fe-S-cluster-containing hydrogenase component 2
VYCDPELCTGCRACELVCSGFHERVFNPRKSRIHVIREEPATDVAITCHQCTNPPCALACPFGAIRKLPDGLVEVSAERCRGCGFCVEACPFGAIKIIGEIAAKCDLCGGDPACIKQCPADALRLVSAEQVAAECRRKHAAKLMRPTLVRFGVIK